MGDGHALLRLCPEISRNLVSWWEEWLVGSQIGGKSDWWKVGLVERRLGESG